MPECVSLGSQSRGELAHFSEGGGFASRARGRRVGAEISVSNDRQKSFDRAHAPLHIKLASEHDRDNGIGHHASTAAGCWWS